MEKTNWLKRIRIWFLNKRMATKFIKELMAINEVEISLVVKILEGLDQDKMYIAKVPSTVTAEEMQSIVKGFKIAASRLNWTAPQIMFINTEVTITEKPKGSENK